MNSNEQGGYRLVNSREVMAALWISRARESGLGEVILKSAVWVDTEGGRLTCQVDLDEADSKIMVRDLTAALGNEVETRPEYRKTAKQMLIQHLQIQYDERAPAYARSNV